MGDYMKVRELIEHLKKFNPEFDVVIETELGVSHINEPRIEFPDDMSRKLVIIEPE